MFNMDPRAAIFTLPVLPTPATVILPGFALASAIKSFKVLNLLPFGTMSAPTALSVIPIYENLPALKPTLAFLPAITMFGTTTLLIV